LKNSSESLTHEEGEGLSLKNFEQQGNRRTSAQDLGKNKYISRFTKDCF
jgi:hypothetical protein